MMSLAYHGVSGWRAASATAISSTFSSRARWRSLSRAAMLDFAREGHRLPGAHPQGTSLRRRRRDAARAGARAVEKAAQHAPPQARGPAIGVLVQAARRLQQDGRAAEGAP